MANIEKVQKKLSDEVAKFNQLQKDVQKLIGLRQTLDAQLNENSVVKEEMDLLEDEAVIFKLIGPAMLKQDLKESKDNVANRIKYISEELKRHETSIKDLESKQDDQREVIAKLQQQFQAAQQQNIQTMMPKAAN
ncbi:Prefoldin subunit 6 [Halotydeus destructor]|nr:Prefoldin subunit 6 [Halotydeus destructor]